MTRGIPLPSTIKAAILKLIGQAGYRLEKVNTFPFHSAASLYNEELYRALFPASSLEGKKFYNIGAGRWRHPYWTNVDYTSDWYHYENDLIDINWDIASLQPVTIPDNAAELVYSSHTIEHLLDSHVDHLLHEMCRILKPGGVARITTPNIRLYYEAYRRRDIYFNFHYGYPQPMPYGQNGSHSRDDMALWLVQEMASQLMANDIPGHSPPFKNAADAEAYLDGVPMETALSRLSARIDFDLQRKAVGHHVSWWTVEKLRSALERAGFSDVIVSVPGGSVSPVMRDREYFDIIMPTASLFVEGVK